MSGRSYDCPLCHAYAGRGRPAIVAHGHKTIGQCIDMTDRSIAVLEEQIEELKEQRRKLLQMEDSGVPHPWANVN